MQFYNLQFRYRAHWIAAEKREIRALYWPRSWPRRRAQHLAIAKYMERNRILFLHCGLFYYCSLFSVDFPRRSFRACSKCEGPTGGASYRRRIFAVVIQRWLSRETRGEKGRDSEKGNHKSKKKTDRNVRPVHRVSNFNERQILVKLQYLKSIYSFKNNRNF